MTIHLIALCTKEKKLQFHAYVGDGAAIYHKPVLPGLTPCDETEHCWYVDNILDGIPNRLRKSEQYKLIRNGVSLYMFGTDAEKLVRIWNESMII